jgi:hypothetical protein
LCASRAKFIFVFCIVLGNTFSSFRDAENFWFFLFHALCACMHACLCVCLVCMYACMYVCMHACMYVCMHACMYVCMHACMYVCMYVCVCVNVCMSVHVCMCLYVCMHGMYIYVWCMYVCMYVCMHACIYACMYIYMCGVCMYACIYICVVYVHTGAIVGLRALGPHVVRQSFSGVTFFFVFFAILYILVDTGVSDSNRQNKRAPTGFPQTRPSS